MGIVVNTNVSSMLLQRSLGNASGGVQDSLAKLSTGSRINRASDDAAGLTISESLTSQARGSSVAQANAQNGVNLLQTAEGDLSIVMDNLQRIRDLSIQAANGTNATAERDAIKEEVTQRAKEISRIANSSQFNKINLLDGTATSLSLQISPNFKAGQASLNTLSISSPLTSATATSLGINSSDANFMTNSFASSGAAASFIGLVDAAIKTVTTNRTVIGSLQSRLQSTIQSLSIRQENMAASNSRIRDVDVAKEADRKSVV